MDPRFEASCDVRDYHVTTTTSDLVDGFERKSFELLKYINSLESKLEQERSEFNKRKRQLEGETISVERKLETSELENAQLEQDHHNYIEETERTIQSLTKDLDATDLSLRKERRRVQDLDNIVTDLKHKLLQKQQFYDSLKVANEKEMSRLQKQAQMLTKKVSQGWILGRLSEVYLRMEPLQQEGSGGSEDTEDAAGNKSHINMDSVEKEIRCLIESSCAVPESRKEKDAARAQQGTINSDDEESEAENEKKFQRKLKNLRSTERGENVSPRSRNVRKQRLNIVDFDLSPSIAQESCVTDLEITRETESCTSRNGQNYDVQPTPNGNGTVQRSRIAYHSKSPSRDIHRPSTGSSGSQPLYSYKKDVTCNINTESSNTPSEPTAALSSPRLPADKDIFRRQKDFYNFISNTKSKSKTKITSSCSDFQDD